MKSKITTSVRPAGPGHEHLLQYFRVGNRIASLVLLLLLATTYYSCTDEFEPAEQTVVTPGEENPDPENPGPTPGQPVFGQVFIEGSELYALLVKATQNTGVPIEDITCINFVYPLTMKKYDSSFASLGTTVLNNDAEFYNYLLALSPNQPISLSYPIETIDSNGELFSINSNDELLDNLKICMQEAVIAICNGMFASPQAECYWLVAYQTGADNTYAGGRFLANEDQTLVFEYNGQHYQGNWVFLFVNDELHININLEGTSDVANYWNIDQHVSVSPDETEMTVMTQPKPIKLEEYCGTLNEYAIGDTGPAGGLVFYDKGEYSDGWRYMEISISNLAPSQWGCPDALTFAGTSSVSGIINSVRAANYHDGLSSSCGNGSVAARTALLWSSGADDWFLPSEQELELAYDNLQATGMGNFMPELYWSSTEQSATEARVINFADGSAASHPKGASGVRTRAVRHF